MRVAARIAGLALAVLATGALVALSDVVLRAPDPEGGLLRLSWRAVGRRVEACREPTPAELEALPPHMRPDEICEGRLDPFRLAVRLDGELVIDREVRPAGAREDRPTYVFDEIRLSPGPHQLEVTFVEAPADEDDAAPPLRLATPLRISPGRVLLVTRDGETGALVLLEQTPGAGR